MVSSPRSAESRRRCRVKALQRPGGVAESRRYRVPAVLTQAAQSPSYVDSSTADSTQHQHQAAAPSHGACRDQAEAAQSSGGAESQSAQSPCAFDSGSTESSWHCQNHGCTESNWHCQNRRPAHWAEPSQGAAETWRLCRLPTCNWA